MYHKKLKSLSNKKHYDKIQIKIIFIFLLIIILLLNFIHLFKYSFPKVDTSYEFTQNNNNNNNNNSSMNLFNLTDYKMDGGCDFTGVVKLFKPNTLKINCNNIHEIKRQRKLGSGFWRKVYLADWHGEDVAIKLVRRSLLNRTDIVMRHVKEAAVLSQIKNNDNIVSLLGWCNTSIIVQYVPKKLEDVIFNKSISLSVKRSLEMALDAAKGLAEFHSIPGGPFAHLDIQTRQFLLDKNDKVLLNDFNRMKYTGSPNVINNKNDSNDYKCLFYTPVSKGKWRSPEEYANKPSDEKVDIYSISIVFWTFRSREEPFKNIEREDVYYNVIHLHDRPNITKMMDYPERMKKLIIKGWDPIPSNRPTATELVQEIQAILMEYKE